jgi:hypothetical protein
MAGVKAFASVIIIVRDNTISPVSVLCHRSDRPAILSTPPFHHDGISPQRIGTSAGPSTVGGTTSMGDVGAMCITGFHVAS